MSGARQAVPPDRRQHCAAHAGAELTLKQLLDRVRQAVQGAFANSELPSRQQVAAAGYAPEEERRIMPTFFALHDGSFFEAPAMTGLEARGLPVPPACPSVSPCKYQQPSQGAAVLRCAAAQSHGHPLGPSETMLQVSRIDLPPEATDRVFGYAMLEMELLQLGGQLSGTLAYNTGLFKPSTAERIASQYQVCRHQPWGMKHALLLA